MQCKYKIIIWSICLILLLKTFFTATKSYLPRHVVSFMCRWFFLFVCLFCHINNGVDRTAIINNVCINKHIWWNHADLCCFFILHPVLKFNLFVLVPCLLLVLHSKNDFLHASLLFLTWCAPLNSHWYAEKIQLCLKYGTECTVYADSVEWINVYPETSSVFDMNLSKYFKINNELKMLLCWAFCVCLAVLVILVIVVSLHISPFHSPYQL